MTRLAGAQTLRWPSNGSIGNRKFRWPRGCSGRSSGFAQIDFDHYRPPTPNY